jgi:phosphoglycolate phosphatase
MSLDLILYILLSLTFVVSGVYYYLTVYQESYTGEIYNPNKPLVVFDFDGTLCDSIHEVITIFNTLAPAYNALPAQGRDAYSLVPTKHFLRVHRINFLKRPFIVFNLRKRIRASMPSLPAFPSVKEALSQLKDKGFVLGILTSNSGENVRLFLEKQGLDRVDFIVHGSTIFGKGRLLKKIARRSGASRIYYVGDEVRDIEACKKAKILSIAATWGYHSRDLLAANHPDYLVQSFEELAVLLGEP